MRKGFVAGAIVIVVALVGLWAAARILSPDDLRERAEQGNATTQFNLGVAYDEGEGVTQDYVEAVKWLHLAAAAGDHEAGKLRDIVAQEMTPEGIAEAQRLAREWKPKAISGNWNLMSPNVRRSVLPASGSRRSRRRSMF